MLCTDNFFWTPELGTPRPKSVSDIKVFEINTRFLYGLRCIGKGLQAGIMLCALLNLPPSIETRQKHTDVISACLEVVAEESMVRATKEAVEHNDSSDVILVLHASYRRMESPQ